ncbi:hypothetical protein NC653_035849 [Populus alba x Populus x berolinensis]|uniref:Uncharacterized protein n=1 Tax=Populus alba x Populus x berolinensis TaxID=444605 RepID=A0AAD6LI92_9ROSI|nr:hypothetical protein NC653_035614 [Populus alba x Populus x berolinensis]KAJ6967476.1 hypothetical protein NC653_035632 [Populus alba x Populus x berolinensis]KAJ6967742.1 hypothetical protein NC653_035849 [Populus alba x Populus x berolinensis]
MDKEGIMLQIEVQAVTQSQRQSEKGAIKFIKSNRFINNGRIRQIAKISTHHQARDRVLVAVGSSGTEKTSALVRETSMKLKGVCS